ncbi:SGS domain-containing protein [Trichoderma ceciliae]
MSYVTLAQQGLDAAEARNWDEAIGKLSTALQSSTNPAWLTARSKALVGLERFEAALDDADLAWHKAFERNKRELLASAQYRRGVAFFRLKQYANADYCYMHCMRLIKGGPAVPKEDPGLQLVDEGGFWKMTAAEATAAARNEDIGKKEETLKNVMGQSSSGKSQLQLREWRMASAMRIQALAAMEKLPGDDPARRLTASLVPQVKGLAVHESDKREKEAAQAKPAASKPAVPNDTPLRLQDFQSNTAMSVSIFSKGVSKEKLKVQFLETCVLLDPLVYPNGDEKEFRLDLWGEIDASKSKFTVTPNKVELSLAKKVAGKWPVLKADASSKPAAAAAAHPEAKTGSETKDADSVIDSIQSEPLEEAPAAKPSYPTSSRTGPKNWDKFGDDDNSEEEKDVNYFFKKLYKDASPEQQRAMMKSFTESNGTSLSTNWDEVKGKMVETVPPDGVEAKKWE